MHGNPACVLGVLLSSFSCCCCCLSVFITWVPARSSCSFPVARKDKKAREEAAPRLLPITLSCATNAITTLSLCRHGGMNACTETGRPVSGQSLAWAGAKCIDTHTHTETINFAWRAFRRLATYTRQRHLSSSCLQPLIPPIPPRPHPAPPAPPASVPMPTPPPPMAAARCGGTRRGCCCWASCPWRASSAMAGLALACSQSSSQAPSRQRFTSSKLCFGKDGWGGVG